MENIAVTLPRMFADSMVLQRNKCVPVWGYDGTPGHRISVSIDDVTVSTLVDGSGDFYVELPTMEAGRGKTLNITNVTLGESKVISDVSVGEVWYMAGQSNMQFKTHMMTEEDFNKVISIANDYDIRMFRLECEPSLSERKDVSESCQWRKLSSKNIAAASAVGYVAAYTVCDGLEDIPVAFIECYYGGSGIQTWLSQKKILAADREPVYNNPEWRPLTDTHWGGCCGRTIWEDFEYYAKDDNYLGSVQSFPNAPFVPGAYYNTTQKPFSPYAIAGVVWYQGESKVNSTYTEQYKYLLSDIIDQWREDFRDEKLPVVLIQLAPFNSGANWHYRDIRQIQLEAHKNIENVGLVTIAYEGPISPEHDTYGMIHPKNKIPVGKRVGRTILGMVYGKEGEYMGPEIDSIAASGGKAVVSYLHVGGGLKIKDGDSSLCGFEISYDGENFVTASADIVGDKVVVYTDSKETPIEVRYCHVNICPTDSRTLGGNLENSEGIPAFPFKMKLNL